MGVRTASLGKDPARGLPDREDSAETATADGFRAGLRDLGYVEGRNIILEFRVAHGDYTRVGQIATKPASMPVDVIVTAGGHVAQIALEATREIPIVTTGAHLPMLALIGSLAGPRVNVTGFTVMAQVLTAKRLEMLRTTLPKISELAVLLNPATSAAEAFSPDPTLQGTHHVVIASPFARRICKARSVTPKRRAARCRLPSS